MEVVDFFNDLPMKICVLSKTKDANVKMFKMIANWNKTKTLLKHISYECKCKFNSAACNSNHKWSNETYQYCLIVQELSYMQKIL